jgi:hypothetical protein
MYHRAIHRGFAPCLISPINLLPPSEDVGKINPVKREAQIKNPSKVAWRTMARGDFEKAKKLTG